MEERSDKANPYLTLPLVASFTFSHIHCFTYVACSRGTRIRVVGVSSPSVCVSSRHNDFRSFPYFLADVTPQRSHPHLSAPERYVAWRGIQILGLEIHVVVLFDDCFMVVVPSFAFICKTSNRPLK
jgi:hypothetical protein